ncbi:serine/threonine-protein phosphatase 1 regulatory subunit 10 isoform X2 [Galleria mellonella]|uniref:Serine/threonine-protein phosphatase 1 regulatory subunit 10 isoform X2 n=1 Tax=Galleria mellonella TaxID=7137 RepID=A0A6J1WPV1_GALME|nr:serine/threonine-protein phosphatase 1 regulatory subunit 10 isoform X2 [Galleria mellonella]
MPRIDPIKLLECLSVLLSPTGGIKSRGEVERLANLMTKFSKKLVSKCIYIQILKCTDTEILRMFMGSGGWLLVHMWLTESIVAKNWPLVRELLELLLLCPVDIERLKTNNCPKLVKELSKDGNHFAIRALATKLVEQWLKTVKGEQVVPIQLSDITQIVSESEFASNFSVTLKNEDNAVTKIKTVSDVQNTPHTTEEEIAVAVKSDEVIAETNDVIKQEKDIKDEQIEDQENLPVLRISLKEGKQVISQVEDIECKLSDGSSDTEKAKDKSKTKNKVKSSERSSSSSKSNSSKYSSKSHSSSNDKHKGSSSHKSSSSSRHSSKDRSRDKEKDKYKSSSHSSKSKSDSNSKRSNDKSNSSMKSKDDKSSKQVYDKEKNKVKLDKEKQAQKTSTEKTEEKPLSPSIHKLGKIPKLSDVKKEKPSISIEVRKPDDPKPKTVKTFHSKFRRHGLEEEIKPPPSRAALLSKKVTPVLPPTIPKRPSPVHNETPPEKKAKTIEIIEKPGAIKLIPPKPKPMMLLESDMFMDALNASATNKKEPKKRKRRTSGSKDGNAPNEGSPPHTPTSITSPNSDNKSVPPRFYQDTLETEENKEKSSDRTSENNDNIETNNVIAKRDIIEEQMDTSEPHTLTVNGLKGVLCYHKRKGPKKSIKWKPDSELEEIQYFELDETERVNVTKPFTDMKYLERIHEREAFQKARNLSNDDVMEEKTSWRPLIPIDTEGQIQVEYGKNSKEKEIQAIRQKGTLQPLYFHKSMIPDSPFEPDPETHPYSEPTIIPLEDVTGNQDNVSDFRNMPWPEPKGNAPPASTTTTVQSMFPTNMGQFPGNFPNGQFPVVPGFQGPNLGPGEWPNGVPPHNMMPPMPTPLPPVMPPTNLPPGMIMPPENMMMGPEMFGGPNPMFPVPPDGFNIQQNMFPVDFNMSGPQGPPGPDGFSTPGNYRGAMRGRGSGGHWRGKNTGNWEGPQRGRGGHSRGGRKAVCIYFQRKGSCRQGDNCSFLHPGVNCPF